jgi:HK97 family phage major capsid protein
MVEETKSVEQYLADLEKGIETFNTKFEPIEAQYKTMTERIDALETKMNTPEAGAAPTVKDVEVDWEKAYDRYLLTGKGYDQEYFVNQMKDFAPEKVKLLSSEVLTTGGYFMPASRSARIIERLLLLDPFRAAASTETLNVGDTLEFVTETGAVLAGWTSERAARAATLNETFGLLSIPTHPMYAMPQLTQKMARQASFDVEAWHMRRVSEYFAQIEGVAFISGTGSGQPEGMRTRCTAQTGTRTTPSGALTTIPDYDCIMNVQDTLADRYQANASWIMSRGTKNVLRKMSDGMGHYILEPSVTVGQPDTMLGKPIVYMPSMPAPAILTGIYAGHDIALIYGDFKQAYQIVDIPGMISIRDEITTKGQISLYVERMGVGGQVVDDLAYVGLEVDTT